MDNIINTCFYKTKNVRKNIFEAFHKKDLIKHLLEDIKVVTNIENKKFFKKTLTIINIRRSFKIICSLDAIDNDKFVLNEGKKKKIYTLSKIKINQI